MKLKDYVFLGLWILGSLVLTSTFFIMLTKFYTGEIKGIIGGLSCFGWLIADVLYFILFNSLMNRKIDIYKAQTKLSEEYNSFISKAQEELSRAYGYNEYFDKSFSFYSKMIREVGAPVGNSLCNFAGKIKENDTIFLLRIDEEKNCLFISVFGKTIHYDQAVESAIIFRRKLEEISGPDSIIQRKKFVPN